MSTIIEQVTVEVRCNCLKGFSAHCQQRADATIVSTVERGDLVLVPIGWETEVICGQIAVYCPDHRERR